MHSFTGSIEEVQDLLELHPRLFVGINGCSLKTPDNANAMSCVPLQRMMIETDAPWCDCRPTHASNEHIKTRCNAVDKKKYETGKLVKGRNEPCNIVQVLEAIAGIRGLNNTYALAETLFRITDSVFFPKSEP